jgi:hypothetical protein
LWLQTITNTKEDLLTNTGGQQTTDAEESRDDTNDEASDNLIAFIATIFSNPSL